jgi:thioester reductase-like protein
MMENSNLDSIASLPALLDHWSTRQTDMPIFSFRNGRGAETEHYDYHQFAERTSVVADALRRAGLEWGDRVLLLHPPSVELVVALLACMRIGALATVAPVTASASLATPQLRRRIGAICSDCQPSLALGLSSQEYDRADTASGLTFLATDTLHLARASWRTTPHELALLQYTSGSTSQPRGVAISHANIIANARALIDHIPVGATWLPQFHDMGLIGHYLFPIVMGGSSHGMSAADFVRRPDIWLRIITERRATFAAAPPFAFEHLLRRYEASAAAMEGIDLSSLRVLMCGAEPVSPRTCRRFVQCFRDAGLSPNVLVVAYGLAEATLAVTKGSARIMDFDTAELSRGVARPAVAGLATELCSCGPPLNDLCVDIVCPDSGLTKPAGEVGEIRVSGASVAPFYWHERKTGRERTQLHTRDIGFIFDGEVYVCGRADDVIIQRGQNFHPQDIEQAAEAGPGPRRASAAFADSAGRVTLLIEVKPGRELPDVAALAARVAASTSLRVDRVVAAPPLSIAYTTSGKLARAETRQRLEQGLICPIFDHHLLPPASSVGGKPGIAWLRGRLRDEIRLIELPLAESGIDSLQLVQFQLDFEELLDDCRIDPEVERLDGPVLLSCRCGDLVAFADALEHNDRDEVRRRLKTLRATGLRAREADQLRIAADARMQLAPLAFREPVAPKGVLLTGGTGFLGPHLLARLLDLTSLPIIVLARGADDREAGQRVDAALRSVAAALPGDFAGRLRVWCSDLALPDLGLSRDRRDELRETSLAIYHNAALVNYICNYAALRLTNVLGTKAMLDLAMTGADKHFHHVSSTFIFGWTRKRVLYEEDGNVAMEGLDFGYSQSKWVAEQLVGRARVAGLRCTVYRPSLISVARSLRGDVHDVAARLLAFMIRHEIAVDTPNQISLVPVDSLARNLVVLSQRPQAAGATYHLTADRYYSLTQLTRQIGADFGFHFREMPIPEFIARLNLLARPEDPVFPLLDFFNRSAPHIAAMTLKRYDNRGYRLAKAAVPGSDDDPALAETARRLVRFVEAQGWIAKQPRVEPARMTR